MMTSIQKQLQNLQMRLRQENEDTNSARSGHQQHPQPQATIQFPPQTQAASTQQFPHRQLSMNSRQPNNNNLQLHLGSASKQRTPSSTFIQNRHNGSQALCLSPRPRPRQCIKMRIFYHFKSISFLIFVSYFFSVNRQ